MQGPALWRTRPEAFSPGPRRGLDGLFESGRQRLPNWDCAAEAHFKRRRIELAQSRQRRDGYGRGAGGPMPSLTQLSIVRHCERRSAACSVYPSRARSAHRSCDYRHRCGNRGLNTSHEVDTLWIILGARALSLTASSLGADPLTPRNYYKGLGGPRSIGR
jgi:hypothetical protein